MKQLITTAAVLFSATVFAQVGINNTSPKATLDITAKTTDGSKPEGLIIPQVAGNQIRTATASGIYGSSQKGLIVYASSADSSPAGATVNITAPGYYYFDGSVWQRIATGGSSLNTSLASGNIYVGNASNVATALAPTGDVTISNTGVTSIGSGKVTSSQIADGTVANADLASAAALTVKGNATNAAATPTDIAAGTDGYVLRRSGTALGFGTVATAGIADNAVTVAKLPSGATATTFLRGDGTWVTPTDTNTTYTAGTGLSLSGTTFSATDASTSAKGIVQLAGDLAGTATSPTVAKIQNKAVSSTAPSSGQVLKYNSTTSAWEPAADNDTNTTYTAGTGLSLSGTTFSATDASTSAKGTVQLAGDLAGTAASPTVAKIQNNAVSATAPTSGQVLGWNGTAWAPTANGISTTLNSGNILVGNASNVATAVTPTGDVTISNTGVTSIGTGKVTNSQMASAAALTVKGNATNASATPTDIAAGTDGYVLRRSGTALGFGTVDTAGITDGAVTAGKLNQMSATSGQVLGWNGTAWAPITVDNTNDAWANDTANTMVKIGTKSDGTARTAGTDVVVKDDGKVGIGTATPTSLLDLVADNKGTGGQDDISLSSYNSTGSPSPGLIFRVARGTAAAPANLQNGDELSNIMASGRIGGNTTTTSSIITRYKGDGATNLSNITFNTSGTDRLLIDENGRVGIGTATPKSILHANTPTPGVTVDAGIFSINNCGESCYQATARNIVLSNSNSSSGTVVVPYFAYLDFVPSTDPTAPSGASIRGIDRDGTNNYAGVSFYTRNATDFNARMTIKSSGNVGIGTESPVTTLTVNGIISSGVQSISTAGTVANKTVVSATVNFVLPSAVTNPGAIIYVRNINSTGSITVTTAGGNLFNGGSASSSSSYTMYATNQTKSIIWISDGVNWTAMTSYY